MVGVGEVAVALDAPAREPLVVPNDTPTPALAPSWAAWSLDPFVVSCCAAIVLLEVATAIARGALPIRSVGRVPLGIDVLVLPFVVLAAARAGALGLRWAAWRSATVVIGAATALGLVVFLGRTGTAAEALALGVAFVGEEVAFRFAAIVVFGSIAFALMPGARKRPRATDQWPTAVWIIAIGAASGLFAVMPGHVEQVHGLVWVLPFLAFGVLFGEVAARTGTIVPGIVAHFAVDLFALSALSGALTSETAAAAQVVLLVALVVGALGVTRHRDCRGANQIRNSPRVIVIE